jgi:hypothetical protein
VVRGEVVAAEDDRQQVGRVADDADHGHVAHETGGVERSAVADLRELVVRVDADAQGRADVQAVPRRELFVDSDLVALVAAGQLPAHDDRASHRALEVAVHGGHTEGDAPRARIIGCRQRGKELDDPPRPRHLRECLQPAVRGLALVRSGPADRWRHQADAGVRRAAERHEAREPVVCTSGTTQRDQGDRAAEADEQHQRDGPAPARLQLRPHR